MSTAALSPDVSAELADFLRRTLREGFTPSAEVAERSIAWFDDEADEAVIRAAAEAMMPGILAEQRRLQAAWPTVTDCDRLDRAFTSLQSAGIVARQNFTCCQSCGHAEIGMEIDEVEQTGQPVHGYTFFHMQDTESAVQYGSFYLAYGSTDPSGDSEAVGHRIVAALEKSGLKVVWNGSVNRRIQVHIDWKKRLSA